jgi:eukaryotic translation initiation factor 2C
MELLKIQHGQKRRGAILPDQAVKLIRIAAQRPADKQRDINAWVEQSKPHMKKTARDFEVEVEQQPVTVPGRLLPAPVLEYGKPPHQYAGTSGAWNMVNVRALLYTSNIAARLKFLQGENGIGT